MTFRKARAAAEAYWTLEVPMHVVEVLRARNHPPLIRVTNGEVVGVAELFESQQNLGDLLAGKARAELSPKLAELNIRTLRARGPAGLVLAYEAVPAGDAGDVDALRQLRLSGGSRLRGSKKAMLDPPRGIVVQVWCRQTQTVLELSTDRVLGDVQKARRSRRWVVDLRGASA